MLIKILDIAINIDILAINILLYIIGYYFMFFKAL